MQVIVPLKEFDNAKQRLADILTRQQRRDLSRAMARDVLEVVSKHPLVDGVTLLSGSALALDLAQQYQVKFLAEHTLNTSGLNNILQAAIVQITNTVKPNSTVDIMILHGDLPLISAQEITHLIEQYQAQTKSMMLIAPDRHGTGTNCLAFQAPCNLTLAFGSNSYAKHCNGAKQSGLLINTVELMGTKTDIDLPEDLLTLLSPSNTSFAQHSRKVLLENEVDKQLFEHADTHPTQAAI